jgi:hypothetical protein
LGLVTISISDRAVTPATSATATSAGDNRFTVPPVTIALDDGNGAHDVIDALGSRRSHRAGSRGRASS